MKQQIKDVHTRTSDPLSQSSLKEYNSDIDDIGQDSDLGGGGYDERNTGDNNSDPIKDISDDDFYNDDHYTKKSDTAAQHSPVDLYFDDIQTFTDDDDDNDNDDNYQLNRPIFRRKFKPFKALEGLDQWRPNSEELLDAATSNANTHNDSDIDSIGGVYSDMDVDTTKTSSLAMNDKSMDSISAVSPSLSPTTARRNSINYRSSGNITPMAPISTEAEPPPPPPPLQPSFSHPSFSLYQAKTQDTPKNSHSVKKPAFILDHINNANKPQLPIKKGGLASMALDCINQDLCKFREWQSPVLAEMAKHGSVSKVCMQDRQGRLCRILEMWVEHDIVFSWCVDLTIEERQQLLTTTARKDISQQYNQGDDDDDDMIIQHDSDTDVSASQPPTPFPIYEPNDDDRPYVCVFATTYLNGPRKNIISKLMMADYVAIWPPWTTVPISVDGADMYIHIVTRFMMDDARG